MKERFEIYDGRAEAKKAKGKSKNLSSFHPLFTHTTPLQRKKQPCAWMM